MANTGLFRTTQDWKGLSLVAALSASRKPPTATLKSQGGMQEGDIFSPFTKRHLVIHENTLGS